MSIKTQVYEAFETRTYELGVLVTGVEEPMEDVRFSKTFLPTEATIAYDYETGGRVEFQRVEIRGPGRIQDDALTVLLKREFKTAYGVFREDVDSDQVLATAPEWVRFVIKANWPDID